MPLDLSPYEIDIGDTRELVLKLNAALAAVQSSVNAVSLGVLNILGFHDASTAAYPASPDANDAWVISVPGTISGTDYAEGDVISYTGSEWVIALSSPSSAGVATEIHAASGKSAPDNADEIGIVDTAASNVLKKLTWANLKATLKAYFDTVYQALNSNLTAFAGLTITANSLTVGTGASAYSQVSFAANRFPARASTGDLSAKTISDFALTFLDDADASAVRTTLGITAGGATLGTPVATTSGTSITFSGIPAGTKQIAINFAGVSLNGSASILVQIGDAGGVETTGYTSTCALIEASATTVVSSTTGFVITPHNAAQGITGTLTLTLQNATSFTWVASGPLLASAGKVDLCAGNKSLSQELTSVVITSTNGTDTFDAGEINILYI